MTTSTTTNKTRLNLFANSRQYVRAQSYCNNKTRDIKYNYFANNSAICKEHTHTHTEREREGKSETKKKRQKLQQTEPHSKKKQTNERKQLSLTALNYYYSLAH